MPPFRASSCPTAAPSHCSAGADSNVNELAADTSGEVIDVEKEGSLFLAFQTILARLKTRYTVGFYPALETEDGKFRS